MSIAFVQSKSVQAVSAASVTTAAMTTSSGQFLVVMAARKSAIVLTGTPITDNHGNTWTLAWLDGNIHGVFGSGGCWYAQNITGGPGHTITFTLPSGSEGIALAVAEFSGVALTFALNSTAHTSDAGPGTAIPPILSGNLAGISTDQLLIGSGTVSHGSQPAASTGLYTDLYRADGDAHGGVILSYAIVSAIGTYHYAYNLGSNLSSAESFGLATFKGTSIAKVQSTGVFSVVAPASITTPAITTTSGHFLVVIATSRGLTFTGTVITDSKSNTWVQAWATNSGAQGHAACYYCANCTGGAGHTFTLSIGGDATLTSLSVAEFSGVALTSALDQVITTSSGTRPYTTGSVTTTQAQELLVGGGSVSLDALFGYSTVPLDWITLVVLDCAASSSAEGVILAYQIAPANGTYEYGVDSGSHGTTSFEAVGICSFLPAVIPPPPPIPPPTELPIRRMRRTPHLNVEHARLTFNSLEVLAQVGAGLLSGQGSDPQIMLRWSNDGGRTWSREHWTTLGRIGAYRTRVLWTRLGQARDRVFEVVVSDPVACSLITAYLNVDVGLQ